MSYILGQSSPELIREYRRPGIEFVGGIDDLHQALAKYDVAIAPLLQGTGTSVKILDYLAAGLPVVTTPVVLRGLHPSPRAFCVVEPKLDAFACRIHDLMTHYIQHRRDALRAAIFIRRYYRWQSTVKTLMKLYKKI